MVLIRQPDCWRFLVPLPTGEAPEDSGLRDRALLDFGGRATARLGLPPDTLVLVRPGQHVAAVLPMTDGAAPRAYQQITGRPLPGSGKEPAGAGP